MGLLNHQELAIVKGVGKTPGDTASAEQNPVVIDLLDVGSGISLDLDGGWEPNIPSLKNGGVWADSPISDGRTPVSGRNTNVIETIRLHVTSSDPIVYAAKFAQLGRMIQGCRAYWDTEMQIEPVYIQWRAEGAPGSQFALIFNIDMDVEMEDGTDAQAVITLSVEREYGWRGVRPGGNPKEWTYFKNNQAQLFGGATASLATGSDHLKSVTIANKLEFNTTTAFLTKNHVDIDAADIPGDLPALVCMTIKQIVSGNSVHSLFIGKDSKPLTLPNRNDGLQYPRYNTLAAAAGVLGTDTSFSTDSDGLVYNPVSANARRARISFATSTSIAVNRITWSAGNLLQTVNLLRGRYLCLLRARQNNGAAGDTSIVITLYEGAGALLSFTVRPIVASDVQLHYVGIVGIPSGDRQFVGVDGRGLYNSGVNHGAGIDVVLFASRSTGSSTLDIFDLIFIPIDEGIVEIVPSSGLSSSDARMIYDNTGYFGHGGINPVAEIRNVSSANLDNQVVCEPRGDEIVLTPKQNNRLYFLMKLESTNNSPPQATMEVRLNIVPRWSGVRDK